MNISLTPIEARILGAFIEKELTTPDYYPLSLNALTNACNQKSNREPVLQLEESEVLDQVGSLRKKGLAMQSQDAGSRVAKFRHTLRERLYLENQELAVLAELLLRGPQTPGELRSRCERMATFPSMEEVLETLEELQDKEPPMVVKLERQPGRKEHRYLQLWSESSLAESSEHDNPPSSHASAGKSFSEIEQDIEELRQEIAALKEEFRQFRKQFE